MRSIVTWAVLTSSSKGLVVTGAQLAGAIGEVVAADIRPRISLGSWAFAFGPFAADPWDFDRVCVYASRAGYDGIEINGFRPHPHDEDLGAEACKLLRGRLDELGLGVSGYAPDMTAAPPSQAPLGDYLGRVDSALAFCGRLGVGALRVDTVDGPGARGGRDYLQRFQQLAAAFRSAAQHCQDVGVDLVWEFEPGFWINRPHEVFDLLGAVDHANFRVLFDSSHAYAGAVAGARQGDQLDVLAGGVVEYAQLLRPWLGHLHLIDGDGSLHDGETSNHLPFGTGRVDFGELLDALTPEVFALPWWTVDFCFCATTERDAAQAVPLVRAMATRSSAGTRS